MSDIIEFTGELEIKLALNNIRNMGINISAGKINRMAVREFYQFGTKVVVIVTDQQLINKQIIDLSVFIQERSEQHIWQHNRINSTIGRGAVDLETQINWHQKYGAETAQHMIAGNEVAFLNSMWNLFLAQMES